MVTIARAYLFASSSVNFSHAKVVCFATAAIFISVNSSGDEMIRGGVIALEAAYGVREIKVTCRLTKLKLALLPR